jgi:hypothetical protein
MVVSAQHGPDHPFSIGFSIGPLILRIAVLAAMSVVAGYVLLRPFLPDPGVRTSMCAVGAAAVGVSFELLLSGGLGLPEQLVPLLLAGVALPLYLLGSTDPRFARPVGLGRSLAPWVFVGMAITSASVLCQAWFAGTPANVATTTLHTGVVLTLVTLTWFVVAPFGVVIRVLGAVLASALVLSTAQTVAILEKDGDAANSYVDHRHDPATATGSGNRDNAEG